MKRLLLIITAMLISIALLTGCLDGEAQQPAVESPSAEQENEHQDDGERISIVVQIFPQYDWVRQIIGDENIGRFALTYLLDNAIDTHSFNPSVSDVVRIKTSDVFMYVGGHSDSWVYDVLGSDDINPDIVTMSLLEVLGDQPLLEGFCDDDCDEDHDHNFSESHMDEHVWLSLRFAMLICEAIADLLAEVDPVNARVYMDNMTAYVEQLAALESEFQAVVDDANVTTMVFADRFPFRYLLNDYGLAHFAAFPGCSAESEASFITIISLANRLNQFGLNVVLVTETSDKSIARTVIESSDSRNQRILVLDSIKSVTPSDVRDGATYLSIMTKNLAVLREALAN